MDSRKLTWLIIQNLNKIFKTSVFDEIYWRYRPNFEGDWKEGTYWESQDHSHRDITMKIIDCFKPESVLDLGCNCGPNLARIKRQYPNAILAGLDINPKAINRARFHFPEADLKIGKIDSLPWLDKSFDVVIADAVLMYIGPDKIHKVVNEMKRVAKKAIIIIDFHDFNSLAQGEVKIGHWVRNYTGLFEKIKLKKITKEIWPSYSWFTFGYYIVAEL